MLFSFVHNNFTVIYSKRRLKKLIKNKSLNIPYRYIWKNHGVAFAYFSCFKKIGDFVLLDKIYPLGQLRFNGKFWSMNKPLFKRSFSKIKFLLLLITVLINTGNVNDSNFWSNLIFFSISQFKTFFKINMRKFRSFIKSFF